MQDSIGPEHKTPLHRLALPVSGTASIGGIQFQMELSQQVNNEAYQFENDSPVDIPQNDTDPAPLAALPVAAPCQQAFVVANPTNRFRHCANLGCNMNAQECLGFQKECCTNTNARELTEEEEALAKEARAQEKRERDRKRRQAQRLEKKRKQARIT